MLFNQGKWKISVTDVLLVAAALVCLIGIRTWFAVCMPMGDSFMACHWAGEVLKAGSVLAFVLALVHLFIPNGAMKTGMDPALFGLALLGVFVPGSIISLCQKAEMSCRSLTQPWTVGLGILLALLALADALFYLNQASREKHKRGRQEG